MLFKQIMLNPKYLEFSTEVSKKLKFRQKNTLNFFKKIP